MRNQMGVLAKTAFRPEFVTSEQLKSALKEILAHFSQKKVSDPALLNVIYGYLSNKIVLDPYFGTCGVFVPPHIDVLVGDVCGEAGYIHSIGRSIVFRNAKKLDTETLNLRVVDYVRKFEDNRRPVLIIPYCHEDFTPHDKGSPFLRHGLDDIKLYIGKSSLGGDSLTKALEGLVGVLGEAGVTARVSESGAYKDARRKFLEETGESTPRSWFMVMDAELQTDNRHPSDNKYYILYEQIYKNMSPYHWFDENKPAWISHTTLPHSLAAAMINVTRPSWPADETRICDPFGGSGTVYLEAQTFNGASVRSSDKALSAKRIAEDNVAIFGMTPDQIELVQASLKQFCAAVEEGKGFVQGTTEKGVGKEVAALVESARLMIQETEGNCLDATDVHWDFLEKRSPGGRQLEWHLKFYCCLRGLIRHNAGILRGAEIVNKAIAEETKGLLESLDGFLGIARAPVAEPIKGTFGGRLSRLQVVAGSYSLGLRPMSPRNSEEDLLGSRSFVVSPVEKLGQGEFDVIVADPPYAFNTTEETMEMAAFYSAMLRAMIQAIRPRGGQIVMAVPEISFTGKPIPAFMRSGFVTQEFLRIAKECGRQVYRPIYGAPTRQTRFAPPYYWYSEKALKRSILHFWLKSK